MDEDAGRLPPVQTVSDAPQLRRRLTVNAQRLKSLFGDAEEALLDLFPHGRA